MATLVPCLAVLRSEFNELFPNRAKDSDGWIGDPAHQARDSDHNPDSRGLVHAIDVDTDLGEGARMQDFVDHLARRKDRRLTYIIFNRRIWSASHAWNPRPYTGPDPHTGHAHISADDVPALEQNTSSYHLEEVPVALNAADKTWLTAQINAAAPTAEEVAEAVWNRARRDPKPMLSDTAVNLIGAQITEAVRDGVAIERFPANVQPAAG